MLRKQRRIAAFFWFDQVDAAAVAEEETKVDGGGGAPKDGQCKEEDEVKRYGGKWKDPLALFIRAER